MNPWSQIPYKPCGHTRKNQKREYLSHDHTEGSPEIHALHRLYQWNDERDKHCRNQIDQHCVCRDSGNISTQFSADGIVCSFGLKNFAESAKVLFTWGGKFSLFNMIERNKIYMSAYFKGDFVAMLVCERSVFIFAIKNQFGERLANAYFLRKNGLCFGEW